MLQEFTLPSNTYHGFFKPVAACRGRLQDLKSSYYPRPISTAITLWALSQTVSELRVDRDARFELAARTQFRFTDLTKIDILISALLSDLYGYIPTRNVFDVVALLSKHPFDRRTVFEAAEKAGGSFSGTHRILSRKIAASSIAASSINNKVVPIRLPSRDGSQPAW